MPPDLPYGCSGCQHCSGGGTGLFLNTDESNMLSIHPSSKYRPICYKWMQPSSWSIFNIVEKEQWWTIWLFCKYALRLLLGEWKWHDLYLIASWEFFSRLPFNRSYFSLLPTGFFELGYLMDENSFSSIQ